MSKIQRYILLAEPVLARHEGQGNWCQASDVEKLEAELYHARCDAVKAHAVALANGLNQLLDDDLLESFLDENRALANQLQSWLTSPAASPAGS
jgi:hypothetical protein